jgi:hypothetical protein
LSTAKNGGWERVERADELIANAHLIAAAPELLAALESAFLALGSVGGNTWGGPFRAEWEQARAALAKAEGGVK